MTSSSKDPIIEKKRQSSGSVLKDNPNAIYRFFFKGFTLTSVFHYTPRVSQVSFMTGKEV